MDTSWLESLLSLVEHGSFTRAAEAQHLSQPAFSRRIRALEHWFGTELIDRSTFPAKLTPVGMQVAEYARDSVATLSGLRDEVRGRQFTPRHAVRLAMSHTLAQYFFPAWWATLVEGEEAMTCQLMPTNTLEAYDTLLHGGCDLLLTYADPAHPIGVGGGELESVSVASDRFSPYSAVANGTPAFTLSSNRREPIPLVTHGSGAFLGRVAERVISSLDVHLRPVAQTDLTPALAGMVTAGLGVGWLPGFAAGQAVQASRIRPIGGRATTVALDIRLCRRKVGQPTVQSSRVWDQVSEGNIALGP